MNCRSSNAATIRHPFILPTHMALKATIFKAQLQIADMDRNYYAEHALTLARHPSETDERMMVRVLVFALHAHERLELGKGLSDPDEPDLWRKDLTGQIEEWIDLGQPDEKNVIRACGRAAQVFVYGFNRAAEPWWQLAEAKLARVKALQAAGRRVLMVGDGLNDTAALAAAHVSVSPASALDAARVADLELGRYDLVLTDQAVSVAGPMIVDRLYG